MTLRDTVKLRSFDPILDSGYVCSASLLSLRSNDLCNGIPDAERDSLQELVVRTVLSAPTLMVLHLVSDENLLLGFVAGTKQERLDLLVTKSNYKEARQELSELMLLDALQLDRSSRFSVTLMNAELRRVLKPFVNASRFRGK